MTEMSDALKRYRKARFGSGRDAHRPDFDASDMAEMQAAMRDALKASGELPDDMRAHLAWAFEQLCNGAVDELFVPPKRKGGPVPNVFLRSLTESAVRYVMHCERGLITDQAPHSTVAVAFGVSVNTVGRWRSTWGDRPAPPLREDLADLAKDLMLVDGERYKALRTKQGA